MHTSLAHVEKKYNEYHGFCAILADWIVIPLILNLLRFTNKIALKKGVEYLDSANSMLEGFQIKQVALTYVVSAAISGGSGASPYNPEGPESTNFIRRDYRNRRDGPKTTSDTSH